MKKISSNTIRNFRRKIYRYFNKYGRDLPWRNTDDPYHILVSEIMLQQTQVDRVIDKYNQFITQFPTIKSLAKTSQKKVLKAWQGLGYNRRALMIHKCAQHILKNYNGIIPDNPELLQKLPGLGKATSAAICVFAFNTPVLFIETNIRTVFIHQFFPKRNSVTDDELIPLIKQTLDKRHPGKWYSALMDYGTHLKKKMPNAGRKSAHHTKQSRFKGSDRQIRGKVLKLLLTNKKLYFKQIMEVVTTDSKRLQKILKGLVREEFIRYKNRSYFIKK